MKKYKMVVFDVDGTLLDTTEGVLAAVEYTIEKHRLSKLSGEELLTFIGPPIQNSFQKHYGLQGDILQELATTFRNRYKDVDLLKAVPYEGIYEVLQRLKEQGIESAVATYKREDYALTILRHFHFDDYCEAMYGADHENKLKKVDIIRKCIEHGGISDPGQVLMIGDSDNDAVGAESVGADFLGVTYGFGFKDSRDVQKFSAIGCADKAIDILKFL